MRHARFRPGLFAALMLMSGVMMFLAFPEASSQTPDEQPEQPKLVVLVVFDQMRGDYLPKWQKLFDKDGFGRLLSEGASYQNCHYPYAWTLTACGHAALSTGSTPSKNGIISNGWYDATARAEVTAVSANRYRAVPEAPNAKDRLTGPSPERMKQPTVGEGLHKMSQGKAKVVSLSIKDRAAILLAGMRAAAVYWYNTARNLFLTSSFYRDTPHAWVEEFNKEKPADRYFGKDWTRLRPDLDYAQFSGPDDVAAEGIGYKQGRVFPHPLKGGLDKPGRAYYDAITHSPAGNEILLELAKRAIDAEKLGQRDQRDLLCLSFSCNDLVGHTWGPDSQEVLDITLRSDLIMKELLRHLDAKVGRGRYVVVVTADHGVGTIPELVKARGQDAGRLSSNLFTSQASAYLQETFAPQQKKMSWVEKQVEGWIYLNHATLKEVGVPADRAEQALTEWLRKQPGIYNAYGRTTLEKGPLDKDPISEMTRLSYYAGCSGDVAVVLKPNYMVSAAANDKSNPAFRATHGSPHPYDTHVPLVVFGTGIRPGVRQERVTPLAAAAILARALGIPPPAGAEYPVPEGLFK